MIGQSRRAVSLAVAAALLAPPRLFGGEPAAAGLPVVLFLSDLPSDEAWLAGLDEALNGPPGAAAPLVVQRAVPDGGERLPAALFDSYRPAAVVSRRPLPDAAMKAAESRGLRVLVFPPERDAATAARELPRAPGGGAAAAAHLEFGDDRAAERALERLLAESPGDSEALGSLAALRRRELRFWPALDAAEKLEAVPGLPRERRAAAARSAGELRALLGDMAGAARAYERALALVSGDPAALAGLAQARRDRPEEALPSAERAASGPAAAPAALRLLAEIRLDLGDAAAARSALERALAANPSDLEALWLMVSAEKGRPARAAAYAARAAAVAEKEPLWRRPDACRLSARSWRELGDRDRAAALYRRAAAADPDHLETLRDLLGLRQEMSGAPLALAPGGAPPPERELSEADVLRALDAAPEDLDALRRLIELRRAQGRLRESAALIKRFLSAVPNAPSWTRAAAYRLISRLAWESGDPFPAWFAARVSDPGEPWALDAVRMRLRAPGGSLDYRASEVEVAAARALLGDAAGAEKRLKRFLETFPEDRHALDELSRLTAPGGSEGSGLILYNGRIFLAPGRYAQAVAVEGRRIAAVGGNEAMLARARPGTRRIDLSGRAVVPGFHDAHVHFLEGALQALPGDPREAMEKALRLARSVGVTSVSGPFGGEARPELEHWTEIHRQGKATLRCWLWGNLDAPSDFLAARESFSALLPPDLFHWTGLKGWVDGDFDGWTAALLEPYADRPESRGRMRYSARELKDLVARGRETGLSIHLHAIGDRAVRAALDACAPFAGDGAPGAGSAPAPCVIEHADLTAEPDRGRLAALGIVASVQPSRKTGADADVEHPRRLGPRRARTFAVRSLRSAGVPLAFGSDWPDRPLDPLLGLHAAAAGSDAEERISLEEAIVHYTAGSARAAGAGRELGLIEPGYLADLVVFDRDLLSLSGADILAARVDATIFDGRVVYSRVDGRGF